MICNSTQNNLLRKNLNSYSNISFINEIRMTPHAIIMSLMTKEKPFRRPLPSPFLRQTMPFNYYIINNSGTLDQHPLTNPFPATARQFAHEIPNRETGGEFGSVRLASDHFGTIIFQHIYSPMMQANNGAYEIHPRFLSIRNSKSIMVQFFSEVDGKYESSLQPSKEIKIRCGTYKDIFLNKRTDSTPERLHLEIFLKYFD